MKCMVIGLGNFGTELVRQLAQKKVEIVGIDKNRHRVEGVKDIVNEVYIADLTEKATIHSLPILDMDRIIIAIGENVGDSIITTTHILEEIENQPIIMYCRAINDVHKKILQAMGIKNILTPEIDSSLDISYHLAYKNVLSAYAIGEDYLVAQISLPNKYLDLKLKDIPFQKYNVQLLLVRKINPQEVKSTENIFLSFSKTYHFFDALPEQKLNDRITEDNVLVVFGHRDDLSDFLE